MIPPPRSVFTNPCGTVRGLYVPAASDCPRSKLPYCTLSPRVSQTVGRTYEQPLFIRCLKSCAKLGAFICRRVCAILAHSRSGERRFESLDGARALAFLAVLAVHVDEVSCKDWPTHKSVV